MKHPDKPVVAFRCDSLTLGRLLELSVVFTQRAGKPISRGEVIRQLIERASKRLR